MEQPKPRDPEPPAAARPDRPLGRGLAEVSHVFLSQKAEEGNPEPGPSWQAKRPTPREEGAPGTLLLTPASQVSREDVAAALREFEGALEAGLRVIDSDIPCGQVGAMDFVAIDRAGLLAVIDFETASSDDLLLRGLDHVDWVIGNLPNLRRMYRGQAINFSLEPRLFLLAPQFSARVRRVAGRIPQTRIDWVRYHLVETPGGPGMFFEHLSAE
jgi:hypothetical protein